jgi:formylmethanofuran dehydrogenase subunit A
MTFPYEPSRLIDFSCPGGSRGWGWGECVTGLNAASGPCIVGNFA